MTSSQLGRLIPAAFAILSLAGCSGFFKSKDTAEKSAAEFHQQYNEDKIADIYAASHSSFKNASSQQEFTDLMAAVKRKLGKVVQTANAGFNVRSFNLTTTVLLNQKTTFEQGTATESFSYQLNGDKAVLIGYHISSKELILK